MQLSIFNSVITLQFVPVLSSIEPKEYYPAKMDFSATPLPSLCFVCSDGLCLFWLFVLHRPQIFWTELKYILKT